MAVYGPLCNGELPLNGNHFGGTVEGKWRAVRGKYSEQWQHALLVLSLYDGVATANIAAIFDRNLQLNQREFLSRKSKRY